VKFLLALLLILARRPGRTQVALLGAGKWLLFQGDNENCSTLDTLAWFVVLCKSKLYGGMQHLLGSEKGG
jgi:hypothetical protein